MRRSRQATWVALGLQFGLGSGCHRSKPTPQAEVQIVFAADQLGFLAPCGCSSHQLGGAARASAYVRQICRGRPHTFRRGRELPFQKAHPLPAAEQEQAKDKAEALERSWDVGAKAAAARVAASGPYDLALGPDFMRQAFGAWPLLAAGSGRVFDLGGGRRSRSWRSRGAVARAQKAAAALRREGARLVVALVQGTMAEAAAWGEAAHADLALQAGVRDARSRIRTRPRRRAARFRSFGSRTREGACCCSRCECRPSSPVDWSCWRATSPGRRVPPSCRR